MTILNEYVNQNLVPFIFVMSALFIVIYVIAISVINDDINYWWAALLISFVITGFISAILITKTDALEKNHYIQCTIDDSISFNEIYEEYEIIKQEGRVYTLKDKYYYQGAND